MSDELKPCPFGSKGKTEIEGKGQIWRGVKGYSDPQYFQLCHHGRLHDSDTFPTVFVEIRARTEEQAREMWNTCANLATPLDDPRVEALVDLIKRAEHNVPEYYTLWHADARAALEAIASPSISALEETK